MKYFFLIWLFAFSWIGCKVDSPKGFIDQSKEGPANNRISTLYDSLFDQFYYDELSFDQIMSRLDELEAEANQKERIDSLAFASVHLTKGKVYYWIGKYEEAISYYKRALVIRKKHLKESHHEIIRGYINISLCYDLLNDYYLSLEYALLAIKYPDQMQSDLKGVAYNQLSTCYRKIQDIDNSKIHLENAIALFASEKEKYQGEEKRSLERRWGAACHDMATLLLGRFEDAESARPYLENALKVFSKLSDRRIDFSRLANAYHNAAMYYDLEDKKDVALHYYQRSLALNESLKNRDGYIGGILDNMGIIYKEKNQLSIARQHLYKSMKYFEEDSDRLSLAFVFDNLGDVLRKENNLDSALLYYNLAMKNMVVDFNFEIEEDNPIIDSYNIIDKNRLFTPLSSKAHTLHKKYQSTKHKKWLLSAFDTYLKIDSLADLMRLEFTSDASKASLVARTKPVYEKAIDLCLKMKEIFQDEKYAAFAFYFAEKSKSIILLEAVRRSKAKLLVDGNLIAEEKALNIKKTFYEKEYALAQFEKRPNKQSLLDSLSKYKLLYDKKLKAIGNSNPAFVALKKNTKTIKVSEIKNELLSKDQSFIEYFLGDNSIYIFVINQSSLVPFKIPLDFDLDSLVNELNQGILFQRSKGFSDPAFVLYEKLIEPIKSAIKYSEKLTISPDGILAHIPFEALLSKETPIEEESNFKTYPYLIKDFTISYNYSATLWSEMKEYENQNKSDKLFAGFAPSFQKNITLETEKVIDSVRNFGTLKWNISEVKSIWESYDGDIFIKEQATIENLRKFGANYQILHFSTHGKANDRAGDLSYILFSKDNNYEYFFTKDLYSLNINANMVVLSACETNAGELKEGEGIISLARGFSYAGASSIVTSLWVVTDEGAKNTMLDFYQNLSNRKDKATALCEAKKAYIQHQMIQRKAHPFYWASFILIGDIHPIILN